VIVEFSCSLFHISRTAPLIVETKEKMRSTSPQMITDDREIFISPTWIVPVGSENMAHGILSQRRKWKKCKELNMILIFAFVFLLTIDIGCVKQQEGTETLSLEDYFRGDYLVTGEPILNQEVEILFSVKPMTDSITTKIKIFLPEGIELVQGNLQWQGDIQQDEVVQVKIIVKPVQEGQLQIDTYVEGLLDGEHKKGRTYYLFFLTKKESGEVSRIQFYEEQLSGKELKEAVIHMGLKAPSENVPRSNEEVVLTFFVIASRNMSHVEAHIVLPEEFILIDGTLEWVGDLEAGKEKTFQVIVNPTKPGRFEILGFLTYDGEEMEYTYYVFVY